MCVMKMTVDCLSKSITVTALEALVVKAEVTVLAKKEYTSRDALGLNGQQKRRPFITQSSHLPF